MAGDHEVWERYARWEGTYTGRAGAGSRAAWAPADPPPMRQQSSPQPPTRGLPDPGDDLDGPFHRGRSPRRDDRGGGRG